MCTPAEIVCRGLHNTPFRVQFSLTLFCAVSKPAGFALRNNVSYHVNNSGDMCGLFGLLALHGILPVGIHMGMLWCGAQLCFIAL